MIAMQYSLVFPADYDMTIIDRRIRDKGPLLDGFPHLRFKAYLSARKDEVDVASSENLYAPFYLWNRPDGASNFLTGPGFAQLTKDFGWPSVDIWMIWHSAVAVDVGKARFASRHVEAISPYRDLTELRNELVQWAGSDSAKRALAVVVGFDPTGWRLVRFQLWRDAPSPSDVADQIYHVGHVSEGPLA